MNWWEEIAISIVVGVLKATIKNPTSKRMECAVITEIADLSAQAKAALGC